MTQFGPPRPDHPAHAIDVYRTTKVQVSQLEVRHQECAGGGEECPQLIAARTADLIAEVMTCPECRGGVPRLVFEIAADPQFAASVIMCLSAAVCHADTQIIAGLDNWEAMPAEEQERIRGQMGWGSDFDNNFPTA